MITKALGPYSEDEKLFGKVYDEYIEYYGKHREDKTAPYEGIEALLGKLKGKYRLGVLSNKPHADTVPLVKSHFGENTFDFVYGQREGFPRKPDPTVVFDMIENMGLTKDEVMYVGDSENDILTANNSGCRACCVLWGFRTYEQMKNVGKCDFFAHNPNDILTAAEEINEN